MTEIIPIGTDLAPKSADEALIRITRICDEKKTLSAEYAQVTESLRALCEEFLHYRAKECFPAAPIHIGVKVATLNASQSPKSINLTFCKLIESKIKISFIAYNPKTTELELFT